ncbi:ferrous iron transporter B [Gephyromycinifex aptenodytis]|uniref:ferrous iron transporter B n=1 Tax=Gephyromycinifex aptenodytis TaxID=2716227 RepID=UPI001447FA5A|nr:ferrous iron transporter B [Gephyromycinifex aptenodytis]
MSGHEHHGGGSATLKNPVKARIALVGSPNSGKTTLFNALTGLRAKTGNYPGVTVARYEGLCRVDGEDLLIEDLPGTYSLDPISPDEHVVIDVLDPEDAATQTPDALLVLLDATTLRRSLGLLAHVLQVGLPSTVVVTFGDELQRRGGALDLAALERALGVPVVPVVGGGAGLADLRRRLADARSWPTPVVPPPTDPAELTSWIDSVLSSARYTVPQADQRTRRIDSVLLHPVWGTLVFFAVMFAFFQTIFTVAAPLQDLVESAFAALGGLVAEHVTNPWLASFLSDALIGGVGGVLVFLPQIALLFFLVSLMEGVGYMSRAAFLMDRVMSRAGLEGRAFVALLSSVACAIPGIMATRTLPSARDRISTMMAAPLMTCSARLPVYVLLIGLLVPREATFGPFGAQGTIMFALYLAGAVSAMAAAWVFQRFGERRGPVLPFYMEMPTYRVPSLRSVGLAVWDSCRAFLRKVTTIILTTTIILWLLLNLPARSPAEMSAAGIDVNDEGVVAEYVLDNSYAASLGRVAQPVFEPLGFDWRINIGVLASLSAREVFVATLGQVAAASDPDNPGDALANMTVADGEHAGEPLFSPPTIAALLVFFLYALQCMATVGVMRRETGSWKWPAIAFGYMFALAWGLGYLARLVVSAWTG